eukprot:jgi/Chlat1/199/Chrsp1S03036
MYFLNVLFTWFPSLPFPSLSLRRAGYHFQAGEVGGSGGDGGSGSGGLRVLGVIKEACYCLSLGPCVMSSTKRVSPLGQLSRQSPQSPSLTKPVSSNTNRALVQQESRNGESTSSHQSFALRKTQPATTRPGRHPRTLLATCLGFIGQHLEFLLEQLAEEGDVLSRILPPPIKASLLALARRRKLLADQVLLEFLDDSWTLLDVSDSQVTDASLKHASAFCSRLNAVDISWCANLTAEGVVSLVRSSTELQVLRCGGCAANDAVMRKVIRALVPKLRHDEDRSGWEELDDVVVGAHSLRYLVWPSIDEKSLEFLTKEWPKLRVNPIVGRSCPLEADARVALDSTLIAGVDERSWTSSIASSSTQAQLDDRLTAGAAMMRTFLAKRGIDVDFSTLHIAERFRLAYVLRDERLAPKRAKNTRQAARRAARRQDRQDMAAFVDSQWLDKDLH